MPSLYDTLGVSRSADADEIKKAYRRQALEHHPDKGGSEEKFKQIQKAYEILSNDQRKAFYDQTGQENDATEQGGGGPFGGGPFGGGMPFGGGGIPFDIGSLFGMFGPQGPQGPQGHQGPKQRGHKPAPKIHEMPISLWDYYHGKRIKIQFERQKFCEGCKGTGAESYSPCSGCGGSGLRQHIIMMGPGMQGMMRGPCGDCSGEGKKVSATCKACNGKKFVAQEKILDVVCTPGMRPHERIEFVGECSDQHEYAAPGDVHIVLQEADEDIRFKRIHGTDDLAATTTIGLKDALLGCSEKMETHPAHPQGLVVEIPVGIQHGDTIVIDGEGMPKKGGGRGALRIGVSVRATNAERAVLNSNKDALRLMFMPS